MELQLGLALPDAPNNHEGSAEGHGVDLDLNMGIGGGQWQPQHNRPRPLHHHGGLLDLSEEEHERPRRTLPLLHWSDRNEDDGGGGAAEEYMDMDTDTDGSCLQPNKATSVTSTYVKVTMDGIGIGRKVDLSLHHSYHSLKDTLFHMFGIYNEDSDNYQLAYQDRGGDWVVVAQHSSWRDLIESTQRLKILKI